MSNDQNEQKIAGAFCKQKGSDERVDKSDNQNFGKPHWTKDLLIPKLDKLKYCMGALEWGRPVFWFICWLLTIASVLVVMWDFYCVIFGSKDRIIIFEQPLLNISYCIVIATVIVPGHGSALAVAKRAIVQRLQL